MKAKVITLFSNKGGVGKTFAAVNLATTLATQGSRVLLLDFDFQAGQDMARMLNLVPRKSIATLLPIISKQENPDIIKRYVISHACGLDFLPAIVHVKQIGHITSDNMVPFFKKATQIYEYIIIDGGKTFTETLLTVLDNSNLILLVATPDILAVYQIKWSLELLQNMHFPANMVKVILNRAESRGGVAWQEVRSVLNCDIMALIPSDGKAVGMALNRGVPCVLDSPKSKIADAFRKLVSDFSKEENFVQFTDIAKNRKMDHVDQSSGFWQKFGISGKKFASGEEYVQEEDEIILLKKKIHERLVERMHVEDLTPEILSDPQKAAEVKASAEKIVSNLIIDEKGMISSHEERVRLVKEIVDEALGLGALEEFLADPEVTDIMANNRDALYIEKHGKLILTNRRFVSDQQMRAIIDRIIAPLGRRIDESVPMVDARLPDGSRFNAIIPPLSLGGPMITIRKFGAERLDLEDLMTRYRSFSKPVAEFLKACIVGRKNIIVSGGTGAGKTTLLNVISEFIPDSERIVTIEDAAELRLKKEHWARLESRPSNVEGKGAVSIRDLFVNSLRMRPDRIIVGECRGPEVLDMLQAMNTGHDGSMTTLHANSTRDVLVRLSSMILLSGIELPVRAINEMVASAIDIIVHVARLSDGTRKITGVTEVVGLMEDFYLDLRDIFVFDQKGLDKDGKVLGDFKATGYFPKAYEDLVTKGIQVDRSLFRKDAKS